MTVLDPDLAPTGEALEGAFALPDHLPEEYHALHTEILNRLRNEARAVSMSTVQTLIMERIAYFYVVMKYKESTSEIGLKEQKEMLDFWLKTTTEFNKMLQASESKSRTTLLVEVQNVLRGSLKHVKDPDTARLLSQQWSEEFARIDI